MMQLYFCVCILENNAQTHFHPFFCFIKTENWFEKCIQMQPNSLEGNEYKGATPNSYIDGLEDKHNLEIEKKVHLLAQLQHYMRLYDIHKLRKVHKFNIMTYHSKGALKHRNHNNWKRHCTFSEEKVY